MLNKNHSNKKMPSTYVEYYLSNIQEIDNKFLIWISKVEKIIYSKLQMSLIDLPDEDYMYYFENNFGPREMVQIIYESNNL